MTAGTRDDDWVAVHDPSTTGERLAAIGAARPEFANAIAGHPQAYPELVAWARSVAPPVEAPAVPSASSRDLNEGARRSPGASQLPPRPWWIASLVLLFGFPLVTGLLGVVEAPIALWLSGSPTFVVGTAGHLLFMVAALLSAPTAGRAVGAFTLTLISGVLCGFSALATSGSPGQMLVTVSLRAVSNEAIVLSGVLLFLAWALARPLRGFGYVAVVIPVLAGLGLPLLFFFLNATSGAWEVTRWPVALYVIASRAAIPGVVILAAVKWSAISDRRRSETALTASARPSPAGQGTTSRTNTAAVLAFVFAFFVSLAAIILGHVALSQISKSGEAGRGFAVAALVLGYIGLVLGIVALLFYGAMLSSISFGGY